MTGAVLDALRMERVRVLTVRSTYVLAALGLLLAAAVTVLLAAFISSGGGSGRGTGADPALTALLLTGGADAVPLPFVAVFMGVLGVLTVGHDYRHGLSRSVFAAMPDRSAVVIARLVVLGGVAVAVSLAAVAVNVLIAAVMCPSVLAVDPSVARALVGSVLLAVLWAWLGAAGTWLLRGTVPVLTTMLVVPLVIEPLLRTLSSARELAWLGPIVRWLPFAAGRAMTAAVTVGEAPGPVTGGLVFAAFVLAVLLPAWVLLRLRDA